MLPTSLRHLRLALGGAPDLLQVERVWGGVGLRGRHAVAEIRVVLGRRSRRRGSRRGIEVELALVADSSAAAGRFL